MKKRPWPLLAYSAALVLIVLSLPLQVAVQYEIMPQNFMQSFRYLTLMNAIMASAMLMASIAAFRASKKLLLFAPMASLCVSLNNFWVGYVEINYSSFEAWVGSALFMIVSTLLLEKTARQAILNPQKQWWKTPARKPIEKPIVLLPWIGETLATTTVNLSETGAYIRLTHPLALAVGDRMQLRMKLEGHRDVRCTARLVRKMTSDANQPAGFGIQFEDLSNQDRRMIRGLCAS